jgi:hypothetical protein
MSRESPGTPLSYLSSGRKGFGCGEEPALSLKFFCPNLLSARRIALFPMLLGADDNINRIQVSKFDRFLERSKSGEVERMNAHRAMLAHPWPRFNL